MSALESIKGQIFGMPKIEAKQLQDWLADYLEGGGEVSESFVASIERGQADLKDGSLRIQD